jgi:hypothetical protein
MQFFAKLGSKESSTYAAPVISKEIIKVPVVPGSEVYHRLLARPAKATLLFRVHFIPVLMAGFGNVQLDGGWLLHRTSFS